MKLFILTAFLSVMTIAASAQCDHEVILQSTTGRFVDGDKKDSDKNIEATIRVSKDKFVLLLTIAGETSTITNTIDKVTACDWKEFLVNGKSAFKVTTDKGDGKKEPSVIRLNSKNGKTTIYFGSDPDDKGGLELDVDEVKNSQ